MKIPDIIDEESITIEREKIILGLDVHWVVLLNPLISLIISWTLFLFLIFISQETQTSFPNATIILLLIATTMITVVNHLFFINILRWVLSNWVITTDRVITFNNTPLVQNDVIFININEIHEIEKKKHGFMRNILDYGDVKINLAASPYPLELKYIPCPAKFIGLIENIRDNKLRNKEIDIEELRRKHIKHKKHKT